MENNYAIITGTSRGIGKALTELFLKQDFSVTGIARTNNIEHEYFSFIKADLSNQEGLETIELPDITEANTLFLINNAGSIGDIGFMGNHKLETTVKVHTLNAIAPIHLSELFISKYKNVKAKKIILNISSGAARSPVKGWGNYCSSKASLNMFSEVLAAELEQKAPDFKVFALAPGIVDTQMQNQIRRSKRDDFPRIEEFLNYKNNNELADPELISRKILSILYGADNIPKTVISLRDY